MFVIRRYLFPHAQRLFTVPPSGPQLTNGQANEKINDLAWIIFIAGARCAAEAGHTDIDSN